MPTVRVYDPAMCCSTGVCGPGVDPVLARFAADVAWLKSNGVAVERFNLTQSPHAFLVEEKVAELLRQNVDVLPIVMVGNEIVTQGRYPDRRTLANLVGIAAPSALRSLTVVNGG
jgi:hypothetical protein